MGIWKDTFDKSLAAVSVKSESLVETSRVRTTISNTQKNMDAAVAALGAMVYNSWLADNLNTEDIRCECEKIKEMSVELDNLKARLEQIKEEERQMLGGQKKPTAVNNAAPGVFCSNCGKRLDASARFCDECGTPVKS